MAISAARRRDIRAITLKYLGDLLYAHPEGDTGLYDDLSDEESAMARHVAQEEGQRLRDRADRAKETK